LSLKDLSLFGDAISSFGTISYVKVIAIIYTLDGGERRKPVELYPRVFFISVRITPVHTALTGILELF